MPLLHKKTFIKKKLNCDLKPEDKVFFCELTGEVFTDYDEFWERLVLLNALVWTCELTGRPNLTYQEALESESKALKCISNISVALKKPLLLIATYTRRGRLADANDDIFTYIRDRYFVGEEVEAIVSNHWYDCKVIRVIMPTEKEILDYEKSIEDSDDDFEDSNPKLVNGDHNTGEDDDDILIIRDDHVIPTVVNNNVNDVKNKEEKEYPPFPSVKYEVVELEAWDYKKPKHHVVNWDQIRRNKSAFTREKCKMFVKQSMMLSLEGYWKLKDSLMNNYKINQLQYSDIFVGNPPKFKETRLKRIPMLAKMKEAQKEKKSKKIKSKENKDKKDDGKKKEDNKKKIKAVMSEEEKEAARKFQLELKEKSKEMFRKKLEKLKIERKYKKDLEKEENRLMKLYENEWWQKKEDLECEDHKNLPCTTGFSCRIPNDYFGEFLMILDFVNSFADILELGDVYPNGISYEMLEYALVEKEVAGVFNDVVQLLLGAIFSLQEEEDEEVEGDTNIDMASMNLEEHLENKSILAAVNIANKASTWSQQYQGLSLQKAPLDALTLTEILRLHILASGATNVANAAWRHMYRGGYKHTDDPGLQFKLEEPEIIKKLSSESLFDMAIEEKIKILSVLVAQILSYASVRDNIEEKLDKLKELSSNYRAYRMAAVRKEKEELNAKKQKMKDVKMKMDKKLLDQRLQAAGVSDPNSVGKAKIVAGEELEEEEEEKEVEKETRATFKKKEEEERRERDFIEQIDILCRDVKQFQLGQDRAFRRYWTFTRIPGLFIEDGNLDLGTCLDKPTPVHPIVYPKDDKELKDIIKKQAIRNVQIRNKEKEHEKNNSDKENDNGETPTKNGIKSPLTEKNLLKAPNNNIVSLSSDKSGLEQKNITYSETSNNSVEIEEEEIVDLITVPERPQLYNTATLEELHSKIFGLCSANSLTCPVHTSTHSRPRWSYISSVGEYEQLIQNLNTRGVRESELRENLVLHKDKILKSIERMSSFNFSNSIKEESTQELKKALKRNLNFPPGTPIDRILELTLRDMILEIEEKIDNGMLGMLKVSEREVWRQAIVDGTSLSFNAPQDLDWGGKKRINQFKSEYGMETNEDEFFDAEEFVSKDGLSQAGVVKELAVAILQVEQALDSRYLKSPLAESDKISQKRRKVEERLKNKYKKVKKDAETKPVETNNEDSSEEEEEEESQDVKLYPIPKNVDNALRTPLERWEKSLMACTSFSQLFLHLATFDNSVSWARSAVAHKRCRVCRRSSDPDNMLLCDSCDGGFHIFCLKPKLKSIPEGDWFCEKCKPKQKPRSPKKQRVIYKEEEEEEEEVEREDDDDLEEEEEEEPEFINQEFCSACEMGGEIVLCDTCPRSFHLDCADLRKIPRGNWSCPLCKEEKDKPSSKKNSKSVKSSQKSNKKPRINEDYETSRRGTKRTLEEEGTVEEFHKDAVETMIHKLMSHSDSIPFRKPIFKNDAPDYYEKIKKPMDLRTIKMRFNKNKYTTDAEFIADVFLIFQNTQQYFDECSPEYKAGLRLSKYFINRVRECNLHSADLIESDIERPCKRKRHS